MSLLPGIQVKSCRLLRRFCDGWATNYVTCARTRVIAVFLFSARRTHACNRHVGPSTLDDDKDVAASNAAEYTRRLSRTGGITRLRAILAQEETMNHSRGRE